MQFAVVIFISIYAILICPFISGVSYIDVVLPLLSLTGVHILLREAFFRWWPIPLGTLGLARYAFWGAWSIWMISGVLAMILHQWLYPSFPFGSHIKLASGYFLLGAGLLTQWEHLEWEDIVRKSLDKSYYLENRSKTLEGRLMEAFTLFAAVPVLTMVLMIRRYALEGLLEESVLVEWFFLGSCLIISTLCIAYRLGHDIGRDAKDMIVGLNKIEKGDFNIKLDTTRFDELGELAQGINQMAQGLILRERIREAFGHFVNPDVVEDFIGKYTQEGKHESMLGGTKKDLTILMCDLRGFTPLSESMTPEELTVVLNAYFTEMVKVIRKHGGIIDKFMGDAIMAIFGLSQDDNLASEEASVLASIEMLQTLSEFNARQKEINPNWLDFKCGIGLHSGEVIAGYIGSQDRLEFTVIGPNVNIAARIEGKTKPPFPPILLSETLANRVKRIPLDEVVTTELKGVSKPVRLFSPTQLVSGLSQK